MSFTHAETAACRQLAELALSEDLGSAGDLTSLAVMPPDQVGEAVFTARTRGTLAGLPAAQLVFFLIDPLVSFQPVLEDGARVENGTRLALVRGPMQSILKAERTALNFLQRLSGVATLTASYAEQLTGLPCQLLDTRKTTPGWRLLEKYAVRMGGGANHRLGLYDGVLIKDNHLAGLSLSDPRTAIDTAVQRTRQRYGTSVPIEVEVDTLDQLDAALTAGADIVLLDNMGPDLLREAVRRRDTSGRSVLLEASGGVTLSTLREIASTGVDRVSVGALTHSSVALDIGLDYLPHERTS